MGFELGIGVDVRIRKGFKLGIGVDVRVSKGFELGKRGVLAFASGQMGLVCLMEFVHWHGRGRGCMGGWNKGWIGG